METGESTWPDDLLADHLTILPHQVLHLEVESALALIEQAGAQVRFLPPYSPDFNPIEKMWSKVKQYLRSAKARTEEALLAAIGAALRRVSKTDAHGWYASCGYVFT